MIALLIIFTIFLLGISLIDFKFRAIPSVLLSGMLFILLFLRFENIQWACILGVFGIILWEFSSANNISFGIADIKILIMFGFFIGTIQSISTFLIAFSFLNVIYLAGIKKILKSSEVPFIPFLFVLWVGGLLGGLWL